MVGAAELAREWTLPPLVALSAAAAASFYLQGWRRLRRRGRSDLASVGRLALFAAGITVMTLAIVSPIDAVGEGYLQVAHMLQHVLLADLGVLMLVLSLRGPLAVFFLPRDLLGPLARTRWLRRLLTWLVRPRTVVFLWITTLLLWHLPVIYQAALGNKVLHDLQHVSFILVGTLVWVLLLDPTGHRRVGGTERLAAAIVIFAAGQALSFLLIFSFRPFYEIYATQPHRVFQLSALNDQKLAGLLMMIEQLLTLGTFIVWSLWRRSRRVRIPSRPRAAH